MHSKFVFAILAAIFMTQWEVHATDSGSTSINDSSKYSWEKLSINMGGFLTTMNSDISLGSRQLGVGVNINLEDALGLTTSNVVVRGDVEYYLGRRHRSAISFGYFGFFRDANKVLESELEIGNSVLPIGTEIDSKFDFQIIKGAYTYSYYLDDRFKLSLGLGLYMMPTKFSVSTLGATQEGTEFIAPLPALGFRNTFLITPKVVLKQNLEVFYIKTGSIKGSVSDINLLLEYNPLKHFGVGAGFNIFRLNFSAYSGNSQFEFEGNLETGFAGILVYLRYYL